MLLLTIPPGVEAPAQPQEGPLRLAGVGVTFGPGRNPADGEAHDATPFQPMLSGRLSLAGGIPKGAQWRLWKVGAGALPALKKGASLRPSIGVPLRAEWTPEATPGGMTFVAGWPGRGVQPDDRVVVELKILGRRRAFASSSIQARFLPASPHGERTPD